MSVEHRVEISVATLELFTHQLKRRSGGGLVHRQDAPHDDLDARAAVGEDLFTWQEGPRDHPASVGHQPYVDASTYRENTHQRISQHRLIA